MIGKKINQLATELAPVSTDLTIIGDPTTGVSKKITLAQLGAIFSGAVSFYTNLAGFPATGDINVIYCAKDTQKLYLWSGSAYVEVFPSQALLDTYQLRSEKGVSNGYASLDSSGKVPISQLPSSIMEYKGTWNASTNTPTLANGTGDTGDVYICNVAGTVNFGAGPITFAVGDYVIYSGTIWQRSSGAVGTVTSVAASITGNSIGITGSPVTTSGTLAFAFAGTGAQYIKGDGTLATFPSTIAQAERLITEVYNSTGATLTKGTIVYINGGQGNLPTVTKALATGDSTSAQTFGVVQADITNNNNGYVVVAGKLSDLDTQAYTEGMQLYLSSTTAGAWTSTKQYAPAHLVYVGIVVRSHPTQGIVEIKIQNGYELDEIHNVAAQTPTNNDGLFWESATSLWKNKSISTILGGTPITGSGNVNAIPKFTANSVLGNSVMEDDGNFVSMRGLKLNASAGVGNTINFQQGTGITAGGLGYSTIGASSTTGFIFYIDQNTTSRNFILDTSTITSDAQRTYSMPATSGTLALVSQLTGGTVTSVGLSSATSGVTIGSSPITTSGTITLAIATASGSQQGLLSSTDWTTFNNKQNALTNPVTGTGTTNYLPKFTGTSTIGNSQIFDNGTNVGIGTATPSQLLHLETTLGSSSGVGTAIQITSGGAGGDQAWIGVNKGTGNGLEISVENRDIIFNTGAITPFGGTERMRLNASGNLGLGVNPSAWASGYAVMQYKGGFVGTSASSFMYYGQNAYSDGSFKYVANGQAGIYAQDAGAHIWYQAPSGTAGNAISFTQAMTLNASGNLSIGNTNDTYKLDVSGTGRFSATSTDYALTLQNIQDDSQGLLVRATDNDGSLFLLKLQSSNTSTGQTWVDRFTVAKNGAATFSSSVTATQLNATTTAAGYAAILTNTNGASDSNGLLVKAGSTSTEYNVRFANQTDTATFFTIKGNGNVGIGTTSPSQRLHVADSSNVYLRVQNTAAADVYLGAESSLGVLSVSNSFPLDIRTNNTTRIWVAAAGNVGIGTTSPSSILTVLKTITTNFGAKGNAALSLGTAGSSGEANLINFGYDAESWQPAYMGYLCTSGAGSSNGALVFATRDSTTNVQPTERMRITSGGNVIVGASTSDLIGSFKFISVGNSGFQYAPTTGTYLRIEPGAADTEVALKADARSGGYPPMTFYTSASERMRISSGGELLVNTTTNSATSGTGSKFVSNGRLYQVSSYSDNTQESLSMYSTTAAAYRFYVGWGGTIYATSTSISGISDVTLKKNIRNLDKGLNSIMQLQPKKFDWVNGDSIDNMGFIAQEIEKIFPELVTEYKYNGNETKKSLKMGDLIPSMVKAIQELKAELDTLKNK